MRDSAFRDNPIYPFLPFRVSRTSVLSENSKYDTRAPRKSRISIFRFSEFLRASGFTEIKLKIRDAAFREKPIFPFSILWFSEIRTLRANSKYEPPVVAHRKKGPNFDFGFVELLFASRGYIYWIPHSAKDPELTPDSPNFGFRQKSRSIGHRYPREPNIAF